MKKVDTISNIKKRSLPILRRHSVKRAAIFGSFARGEAKAKSDVDLLIEYKGKNKSLFDLVDLKSELENCLGRKVDIVTYGSIYWRVREQILSERQGGGRPPCIHDPFRHPFHHIKMSGYEV